MRTGFTRLLAAIVLPIGMAACSAQVDQPAAQFVTVPDQAAADATEKRLLDQPQFDVSKVYVARLEIDGNAVEVTSLVPSFFRGYQPVIRGFNKDDGRSFTLMTFDAERSNLVVYTRERDKQEAYKLLVPLSAIEEKKQYSFPFAQAKGGSVAKAKLAFTELKSR